MARCEFGPTACSSMRGAIRRLTYDVHSDGSGSCYSSRCAHPELAAEILAVELQRRPPNHRLAGGERAACDVITDEAACRGARPAEALSHVLTGTHPEYHTRR